MLFLQFSKAYGNTNSWEVWRVFHHVQLAISHPLSGCNCNLRVQKDWKIAAKMNWKQAYIRRSTLMPFKIIPTYSGGSFQALFARHWYMKTSELAFIHRQCMCSSIHCSLRWCDVSDFHWSETNWITSTHRRCAVWINNMSVLFYIWAESSRVSPVQMFSLFKILCFLLV